MELELSSKMLAKSQAITLLSMEFDNRSRMNNQADTTLVQSNVVVPDNQQPLMWDADICILGETESHDADDYQGSFNLKDRLSMQSKGRPSSHGTARSSKQILERGYS